MISLRAIGDVTRDFDDLTIDVTVGAASDTWSPSASGLSGAMSAHEAMEAFIGWCNAASRAWSGVTFAATWSASTTGGMRPTVTASSAATIDAGSVGPVLGLPSAPAATPVAGTSDAAATVGAKAYIPGRDAPPKIQPACEARSVSWPEMLARTAAARPVARAILTQAQQGALAEALMLASIAGAREGHVYDAGRGEWVLVDVGPVRVRFASPLAFVEMEVVA